MLGMGKKHLGLLLLWGNRNSLRPFCNWGLLLGILLSKLAELA